MSNCLLASFKRSGNSQRGDTQDGNEDVLHGDFDINNDELGEELETVFEVIPLKADVYCVGILFM